MFTATADIRGPLADVSLSRSALIEMSFLHLSPCHQSKLCASAMLLCYLPRHVRQISSAVSVQHSTCHAVPGLDRVNFMKQLISEACFSALRRGLEARSSLSSLLSCMTAFLHTASLSALAQHGPRPATDKLSKGCPDAASSQRSVACKHLRRLGAAVCLGRSFGTCKKGCSTNGA